MIQAPSLFTDAINDIECAFMLLVSLFLPFTDTFESFDWLNPWRLTIYERN